MVLFGLLLAVAGCSRSEYDKTTYDELKQVIDGGTTRLLGRSLDDASRELALEGVRWDEGYSASPLTQLRIYHFKGFYLLLNLRQSPPLAEMPDMPKPDPAKAKHPAPTWWISDLYPALHIDAIKDPEVRMASYWAGVHQGIRMNGQAPNQVVPKENPSLKPVKKSPAAAGL